MNALLSGNTQRYANFHRLGPIRAFRDDQTAFDCGQWLKAEVTGDSRAIQYCESIGLQISNAMGEGTGVGGGYTLPAPVSSTLIEVLERVGVAQQVCQIQPTTGDTISVPKRTGGLTVYAPGENNTITTSDKTFGQVECILKKRAVASLLSNELSDDSLINIVDNLFAEMGYALAAQQDNELINGTGAGATYFGVRGLLNRLGAGGVSTCATGHDTWPEIDLADFTAFVALLPGRFMDRGPAFICSSQFFFGVMARIALQVGGVTLAEVLNGVGNRRQFMGFPVYLTSQMPTSTAAATVACLFGAFDQGAILATRGPVQLARSDDYKFLDDQIALRGTWRYDINVHDSGTASVAGAYVGLKTAS